MAASTAMGTREFVEKLISDAIVRGDIKERFGDDVLFDKALDFTLKNVEDFSLDELIQARDELADSVCIFIDAYEQAMKDMGKSC